MLLTYSYSKFKEKILSGEKKHSLREDPKNRWRAGMTIQHWMGNPRNKGRNNIIHQFHTGECVSVQRITLTYVKEMDLIVVTIKNWYSVEQSRPLPPAVVNQLIYNDGLTREEFISHFFANKTSTWEGKIIHFTKLQY